MIRLMVLVAVFMLSGCGIHYNVRGKVVDATSGKPVEGAAVIIHWVGVELSACLAPYASGEYTVATVEDITDENGRFTIPKYPFVDSHYLGVYKKGYVCWDNQDIFTQQANPNNPESALLKDRTDHKLKYNMVIQLDPFTAKQFEFSHASFTDGVCRATKCYYSQEQLFYEAISEEKKIFYRYMKKIRDEFRKKQ